MLLLTTFINCQLLAIAHKEKYSRDPKPQRLKTKGCWLFFLRHLSSHWMNLVLFHRLLCDRWKYNALTNATNGLACHCLFLLVEIKAISACTMLLCTPCFINCGTAAIFSHLFKIRQCSTAWQTAWGSCSAVHLHSQWELRESLLSIIKHKKQVLFFAVLLGKTKTSHWIRNTAVLRPRQIDFEWFIWLNYIWNLSNMFLYLKNNTQICMVVLAIDLSLCHFLKVSLLWKMLQWDPGGECDVRRWSCTATDVSELGIS